MILKKLRRAKTIQYDEETEYIDKHWSIHSLIDYTCYGILQTSSIWIPLFMTMQEVYNNINVGG